MGIRHVERGGMKPARCASVVAGTLAARAFASYAAVRKAEGDLER